ncbi:hypothetical protein BDN72DRAFT_866290 [Pluteus cervinus]|uniref:Uncharacterized protein n=1 Tax=Pluteus cervinus TaxID=181527 RepID=A0ACD2ZX90_9AGAR|nr:hypothetical protein BDN72DRAFT_866290 [Pluteus cervinus]
MRQRGDKTRQRRRRCRRDKTATTQTRRDETRRQRRRNETDDNADETRRTTQGTGRDNADEARRTRGDRQCRRDGKGWNEVSRGVLMVGVTVSAKKKPNNAQRGNQGAEGGVRTPREAARLGGGTGKRRGGMESARCGCRPEQNKKKLAAVGRGGRRETGQRKRGWDGGEHIPEKKNAHKGHEGRGTHPKCWVLDDDRRRRRRRTGGDDGGDGTGRRGGRNGGGGREGKEGRERQGERAEIEKTA